MTPSIQELTDRLGSLRDEYREAGEDPYSESSHWLHLVGFDEGSGNVHSAQDQFTSVLAEVMKSEPLPPSALAGPVVNGLIHVGMEKEEMDLLDAHARSIGERCNAPVQRSERIDTWYGVVTPRGVNRSGSLDISKPLIAPRDWQECFVPVLRLDRGFGAQLERARGSLGFSVRDTGSGISIRRDTRSTAHPLHAHRQMHRVLGSLLDSSLQARRRAEMPPLDIQFK